MRRGARSRQRGVSKESADHAPAEILDLNIDDCLRHPALSQCCRFVRALSEKCPAGIHVYYLNPAESVKRRVHMEGQFSISGMSDSQYTRVEAELFPPKSTKQQRAYSLTRSHARAWAAALQDRKRAAESGDSLPPGAIFMEDDVCMMKGWRRALNSLVGRTHGKGDSPRCDVVRFDVVYHFESSQPMPDEDSVFAFPCVSPFCAGAYYMSWDAVRRSLEMFESRISEWKVYKEGKVCANEHIIHAVGRSFGPKKYVQCVPPLAVQTWFLNRDGVGEDSPHGSAAAPSMHRASQLQQDIHMRKLRTTICSSLMCEYGHRYNMSAATRRALGAVLRGLYNPRSETRHPVAHILVSPEWIWLTSGGDASEADPERARLVNVSAQARRRIRSRSRFHARINRVA